MTNLRNLSYNSITYRSPNLKAVSNIYGLKSKYRITLEINALSDFNPHQIDFRKVLQLEENEDLESIIEDLDNPDRW